MNLTKIEALLKEHLPDKDIKVEIEQLPSENDSSWHKNIKVRIRYHNIDSKYEWGPSVYMCLRPDFCGCGHGILCKFISIFDSSDIRPIAVKVLELFIQEYRAHNNIGSLHCTLGSSYYHYEDYIKELGFYEVARYNNPQHSSGDTQRLYVKILDPITP